MGDCWAVQSLDRTARTGAPEVGWSRLLAQCLASAGWVVPERRGLGSSKDAAPLVEATSEPGFDVRQEKVGR